MIKAPRRSVASPGAGGALSATNLRKQPRAANGQFATRDAVPVTSGSTRSSRKVVRVAQSCVAQNSVDQYSPDKKSIDKKPRTATSTPAQLVTRVTRAIERELQQIEGIVGGPRSEADKRARTLASLARTLAEVTRLRSEAKTTKREAKANHDDDAVPRDLDEFRRTLERRLAQMVDPPEIVPDRGDDAG